MEKTMTRRSFVAASACAAAALGAMTLAGCGSNQVESGGDDEDEDEDDATEAVKISEMTDEELQAAWEQEEAYGTTLTVNYQGGLCTAGLQAAEYLGCYVDEGLDVEVVNSGSNSEIVGTGKAVMGASHIAELMVPAANGVGITLVAPVQTGCQSLYVLADSEYESLEDLKGLTVAIPNGIGTADQNIMYRFLIADGMDINDVEYKVVTSDAVVLALQNDEIQASMLSDVFAYTFVEEGTLRYVRSLTYDEDFCNEPCCVVCMNTEFMEANPVTTYKLVRAFSKANAWLGDEIEEAAQVAIDESWASGTNEKIEYFLTVWNFDATVEMCEEALRDIIDDYRDFAIFDDNDEDTESILARVWYPVLEN